MQIVKQINFLHYSGRRRKSQYDLPIINKLLRPNSYIFNKCHAGQTQNIASVRKQATRRRKGYKNPGEKAGHPSSIAPFEELRLPLVLSPGLCFPTAGAILKSVPFRLRRHAAGRCNSRRLTAGTLPKQKGFQSVVNACSQITFRTERAPVIRRKPLTAPFSHSITFFFVTMISIVFSSLSFFFLRFTT